MQRYPGAALVTSGTGWLTAIYRSHRDTANWAMHPAGDELLLLLAREIAIVLEAE